MRRICFDSLQNAVKILLLASLQNRNDFWINVLK